jgi:hypothetical protein
MYFEQHLRSVRGAFGLSLPQMGGSSCLKKTDRIICTSSANSVHRLRSRCAYRGPGTAAKATARPVDQWQMQQKPRIRVYIIRKQHLEHMNQ